MTAVRLVLIVLLLCLTHPLPGERRDRLFLFSKERDDVKLLCENVKAKDCSSTTWIYSRSRSQIAVEEVIDGSTNSVDRNRANRLKLEPDCSLKIINVTTHDAGEYSCRQHSTEDGPQDDALVFLSILTVSSLIPASEMKANTTVTFYCQLAIHENWLNEQDGIKLVWTGFDQGQVKDVNPYTISFTRTLTKEDNNRKLQCKVEWKGELKATVDYTINLQGQDGSHLVGLIGAVVGTVAVALCAFLLFLWRRKAKWQTANVRSENVNTNETKEKTEDERNTSGQSKQALGGHHGEIAYAEITITANTRKSSDKPPAQHMTEYATINTKC
ncbi:uncharacterized protein LOC134098259 [Sardina pilchardus]|uniref:uncharacterized protein LOC134098259 n=1 Tax=Sardina pilchardus TaxID=27697 RepID=UPI002E1521B8